MKKITTLVHHIKLNESGWWEKAVQNIIISTIGYKGNYPQPRNEIIQDAFKEVGKGVDILRLEKQFDKLISKNSLISPSENLWQLSKDVFNEFTTAKENQNEIEERAQQRFESIVKKHSPNTDPIDLWNLFTEKLLFPLVKDIGAKTYEFISINRSIYIEEHDSFQDFFKNCNGEKDVVKKIVNEYLSNLTNDTKAYLLKLLNEYFFIEATNLDENTVEEIYKYSKNQQNLNL